MSRNLINKRYEKMELLGEGAFGTIYLAKDLEIDKKVAIKVFKEIQQFQNEKKIWEMTGEITGVVKILDCFEENGTGFLVMEYLSGGTLKGYMEKNLKEKKEDSFGKAEMLRPIMEALHQLHSKGIVHCDVSPDNIMFREDGEARLIDFGAARVVFENAYVLENVYNESGKDNKEKDNRKCESPRVLKERYAAPEQYANPERIGPWTDIYEICVILYEMISGEKMISVTDRMKLDKLEDLRVYVNNTGKVESAVMHGLQLEIQKRFFNMSLFMEACGVHVEKYKVLDGIIRHKWGKLWIDISSQGKFVSLMDDSGKRKRIFRRRIRIAGGILGLIIVILGGSGYYHTHFQEEKFVRKLKNAMNSIQQIADTEKLNVLDEEFEEKLQYLQEKGIVTEEQEDYVYYSLGEDEFLEWGVKSNKCRKMYLDYETLRDACFYYMNFNENQISSNQQNFTSSIYWTKGEFQSLDVVGKKTESWNWRETGNSKDTLEVEYDAADKRVFSLCLTTKDVDRMKVYLDKVLKLCCPEIYLTESEIDEIIEKIKAGDDEVSILCLNEKAWIWGSGYELSNEYYYKCEITASKGTMWN